MMNNFVWNNNEEYAYLNSGLKDYISEVFMLSLSLFTLASWDKRYWTIEEMQDLNNTYWEKYFIQI